MAWNESGITGSLRQGRQPDGDPLPDLPLGNTFEPCPEMTVGSIRQGTKGTLDFNFTKGRGAGRTFEYVYPAPYLYVTSNGPGIDGVSRYGIISTLQQSLGQSPAVTTCEVYKGRAAFKVHALGGVNATMGPVFSLPFVKGGAPQKGDFASWRVKALLAAAPVGGNDIGLGVFLDNGTALLGGTDGGMLLRPNADNTVTFYARPTVAIGLTISDTAPVVLDVSEYNAYEFRMNAATDTEDATLRVLINNEEQFVYSFGDGLLPQGNLQVVIQSKSGDLWLPVGGAVVAGAYDEASTL